MLKRLLTVGFVALAAAALTTSAATAGEEGATADWICGPVTYGCMFQDANGRGAVYPLATSCTYQVAPEAMRRNASSIRTFDRAVTVWNVNLNRIDVPPNARWNLPAGWNDNVAGYRVVC